MHLIVAEQLFKPVFEQVEWLLESMEVFSWSTHLENLSRNSCETSVDHLPGPPYYQNGARLSFISNARSFPSETPQDLAMCSCEIRQAMNL